MGFEKKCECCGKKFETKRYPTKYCSQACYRKMQRTAVNKRKIDCRTDEIPGQAGDDITVKPTTIRHARLDRASGAKA